MSLSAQAATVTATANKSTYGFGETITITTIGDSTGLTADFVLGGLIYAGSLMNADGGNTQTKLRVTDGAKWTTGPLLTSANTSDSFNQIKPDALSSIPADSSKKLTSVMTFTVGNTAGTAVFAWITSGADPTTFFGTTLSAPTVTIIPEPTTAGLMALGLVGLVIAGRRRRS
jgi:hypothetical protein